MTPVAAHEALVKSGLNGMDDPDFSYYPTRWYFDAEDVLCRCSWRGYPYPYPHYRRPLTAEVAPQTPSIMEG